MRHPRIFFMMLTFSTTLFVSGSIGRLVLNNQAFGDVAWAQETQTDAQPDADGVSSESGYDATGPARNLVGADS